MAKLQRNCNGNSDTNGTQEAPKVERRDLLDGPIQFVHLPITEMNH